MLKELSMGHTIKPKTRSVIHKRLKAEGVNSGGLSINKILLHLTKLRKRCPPWSCEVYTAGNDP